MGQRPGQPRGQPIGIDHRLWIAIHHPRDDLRTRIDRDQRQRASLGIFQHRKGTGRDGAGAAVGDHLVGIDPGKAVPYGAGLCLGFQANDGKGAVGHGRPHRRRPAPLQRQWRQTPHVKPEPGLRFFSLKIPRGVWGAAPPSLSLSQCPAMHFRQATAGKRRKGLAKPIRNPPAKTQTARANAGAGGLSCDCAGRQSWLIAPMMPLFNSAKPSGDFSSCWITQDR